MDDPYAVAYFRRAYSEITRPWLKQRMSEVDRGRRPVLAALLDAYFERKEIVYRDGKAEDKLAAELEELRSWLFKNSEIPADAAHAGPLGKIMLEVGYDYPKVQGTLERERKAVKGRPREACLAIEAMEQRLEGRTYRQIAESLLGETFADSGPERIRKLIQTIKPIYEKYKPRN